MSIPRLNTSFEPAKEDLLNFKPYAQKVQNIIRGLSNTSESIVIGIDGEWGSGKSTFNNMVFHLLEENKDKEKEDRRIIKMRYNPWMYSGTDEMLFDFLNEMKKCFYRPDSSKEIIGNAILKYSKYLKSVRISGKIGLGEMASLGVSVEPEQIFKQIGGGLTNADEGLIDLKENVNQLLVDSDIKLVIFIDDLDRLDKDELFTILKLIKLTASFNHVVFIVAMDNNQVANSIGYRFGSSEDDGIKFLEKIINIPISLPLVEDIDKRSFIESLLEKTFKQYKFIDITEKEFLVSSLIRTRFKNPREAIRVINSFTYSLMIIGDEINAHDLFWIEYLKIKCPDLHKELKSYGEDLSTNQFLNNRITLMKMEDSSKKDNQYRDLLNEKFSDFQNVLNFLFPTDKKGTTAYQFSVKQEPEGKLNREKRISHAEHYEKYFSFHTARKISQLFLGQLILDIKENYEDNAALTYRKLIENVDDLSVSRALIENLREPKEIGKVPLKLLGFFEYYHKDCQLDEKDNVNIIDIVPDLIAGLTEKDEAHIKSFHRLCIRTNIRTAITIATSIEINFGFSNALPAYKILKDRILAFKGKAYFELLDSNPYYFHQYWKNSDKNEFYDYLNNRFNSEESIGHFLKLFVNFWNGEIRGMIRHENFKTLNELVHHRFIWIRIMKEFENIEKPKTLKNYSDKDSNSFRQLAEQYLYWVSDPTKLKDYLNLEEE